VSEEGGEFVARYHLMVLCCCYDPVTLEWEHSHLVQGSDILEGRHKAG
jgi:hypothetical protein